MAIITRATVYRRAAWLTCALALIALAVACEIETDLPPRAESIAVAPPATPNPTEAPAPDETATPPPAPTQDPTATPEYTFTPAPQPTPQPESTATPELALTPAPEPTPQPESTATPEYTLTPAPNPTPHPESTATPEYTLTPAPNPTPHPESTATPEYTLTPAPEPTPEPTATPEYTLTPAPNPTPYPEPTRAPGDQVAPIGAPAPAGSTVVTDNGIALTITSFNPDAESVLANENPYYQPPHEGNRFVMARTRVQNVGGDANNPIDMGDVIDRFYLVDSHSEIVENWDWCETPNYFRERHVALFPGGTAEGSVCFEIPKSETDLILMYDARGGFDNRIFFALANPDSVDPVMVVDAPAIPPSGQAAGRSRFNPVPPGRYVESADGLMALTLVSVNMDADFSEFFESYDPNDPYNLIAEGNRLAAARVRVQNIGGDVNVALIVEGGFTLVGSSSLEFHPRGCRESFQDPALFLGGFAEVVVCFEMPESETGLVLIHTSPDPPRQPGRIRAPKLEEPRRWLAFANPDVVEAARVVEAPPESSPGLAAGLSRSNPAPPGASVYTPWGMAFSIVSANLDAAAEILAENPSNDPPAEGSRFVIARTRIAWVGGNASDKTSVGIARFSLVGSSSVGFSAIDNPCGALPYEMPYIELSGGEAAELDVCFEIPESETGLILFNGHPNEESTRWMKMPES